ncbi:MAG: dTDP-4-dehydrorhamnose reductase [Silicimonas sp.]|nr:dTDP-4-dehydrorhamnose reductase [Silicimonas sp.]
MKIALFGQNGQVATEVQRACPPGTSLTVIGREVADFSQPDQVFAVASALHADAMINATAYTAVDKAEEETALADAVNGISVGRLGEACASSETPLVHISTDYVFDGSGTRPWAPGDATDPQGAYGASKLKGEEALRASGARHVILRTSWVFSAHGNNFVKTMLRFGAEREVLRVVDDQIGGPTPAAGIARTCLGIARALHEGAEGGTYHYAGAPEVSWADFARAIFEASGLPARVEAIPTTDYPTPATRPLNSRMDCTSLARDFGIDRPDWRAGLAEVLAELGG